MKTVAKAFLRYLPRRRSLSLLQVIGIACGVAAVVGMVLSARAALFSFSRAIQFLNGSATHSLQRLAGPMEETLLQALVHDRAVASFSPVIDRRFKLEGAPIHLLGIDPFLDQSMRPEILRPPQKESAKTERDLLFSFLLDDRAIFLDKSTASRLRVQPGATVRSTRGDLRLLATFPNPSSEPLALMDIGHAQKLFDLRGRIDRVDLILNDENAFLSRWGEGFRVQSVRQKEQTYAGMLRAFRLNLEALSLIALFVGVFLIYNTTTFAVVTRRKDAGILRSLGASRREVVGAFLVEILLFGLTGGLLGGLFGYILSRFLTGLVGQSISNLYFFLRPAPLPWSSWIPLAGAFFGSAAALLGSMFPLLELARLSPAVTLHGRTPTRRSVAGAKKAALAGTSILAVSFALLLLSFLHVYVGFAGAFAFLLGVSLLTGLALVYISPALKRLLAHVAGLSGRIAGGNIRQNLSRTSVAVAAFMVALSMSVGLGSMIGSFRDSLIWWMSTQLQADVYIGSTSEGFEVPEPFYEEVRTLPGLGGVDPYRNVQVSYQGKPVTLAAVSAEVLQRYTRFGWVKGGNENWDPVKKGEVIVSESFARNFGVDRGSTIALKARDGTANLRIAGVFYDYTTEHGLVMMDRSTYLTLFDDHRLNSVGVFIEPDDPRRQALLAQVRQRASDYGLPVFSRAQLHNQILSVFDSTFAVTRSMRILAIIVAFFGIAGALLTLFIERQREFGIYRALGFSTRQVAAMTLMEGLGMGIVSFLLSIVGGTLLALILIKVINVRSFNWTIFFYPAWAPYLQAAVTSIAASAGAALYPIWKVLRTYPHMQLREE